MTILQRIISHQEDYSPHPRGSLLRSLRANSFQMNWCCDKRVMVGFFLVVLSLAACSGSGDAEKYAQTQQYFFLESLKMVEGAGRRLQSQNLTADDLKATLAAMDDGVKMAFEVEAVFLEGLDPNLGGLYQRFFIEGVQTYRLGIEAGDSAEQKKGLELLSQWAKYWRGAEQSIIEKIQSK